MVRVEATPRLFTNYECWDDDEEEGQDGRDDARAGDGRSVLADAAFAERPAEIDEHEERRAQRERGHKEPELNPHELRAPRVHAEEERKQVNHHDADLRFSHVKLAEPEGPGDVSLPVCDVEQNDGGCAIEEHCSRVMSESGGTARRDANEHGGDAVTSKTRMELEGRASQC